MKRRHDLDWLRVLLFGLLVLHHVAVGFVAWGADIYRFTNDKVAGDWLGLLIYWTHSWRLPALFLIAGIGTYFATGRSRGLRFIGSRVARLLVPALFGTFVLNVVAGYAMARMTGDPPGFWTFWSRWLTEPEPRQVLHLWFLFNLTFYTVLCWPLFAARERLERMRLGTPWLLIGLVLLSTAIVVLVKPHAPALAGDGYQWPYYLSIFAGGYLVGAHHREVLDGVALWAFWLLAAATVVFLLKVSLLAVELASAPEVGEALARGGWVPAGVAPAYEPLSMLHSASEAATAWLWALTALGLSARYLRRGGPLLRPLSRAVFPVYVLHFPLTIVGLALVAQLDWPWGLEFLLLAAVVYLLSGLLYLAADRLGSAVYLIGGRPQRAPAVPAPRAGDLT
ncbi:acyltransferase family protein [Rubellimicrobium roseum]|uniref:Acyltransferase 3 domain-containing protein n=1 Tax=Rubellimicrobium roseum TaxID=687525 RepID=A0A5C4N4T3_9RHOB|nr:acyltransferase family protein [Rubellimicrobium roseum]TNC60302.1 hypothetical protein FHG71_22155 [Rubellimicrobium roseum]